VVRLQTETGRLFGNAQWKKAQTQENRDPQAQEAFAKEQTQKEESLMAWEPARLLMPVPF